MDNLKYDKELYICSGFYEGDEDILHHKEKLVKCRKNHKCSSCEKDIYAGDYALLETGFVEGEPTSCYTCAKCIEEWLEESGQVSSEQEEDEENEKY